MTKSRNTRQRGVILEILRDTEAHPTAEMIYRDARRVIPNISLGTVYRNLNFLRDKGLVREIRSGEGGSSRFEGVHAPHAHFHCRECNRLLDVPLPEGLEQLEIPAGEKISRVFAVDLHIIGACAECAGQESTTTH